MQDLGGDTPLARTLEHNAERAKRLTDVAFPHPSRPRLVAVTNQKGGVGKTTSVVNLAVALAQGGLRVLVVDLDPQGNASTALGDFDRSSRPGIYEVMLGEQTLQDVVLQHASIEGLSYVPSTLNLAGAEIELVDESRREFRLREALVDVLNGTDAVDYVLIDCPPSLGLLTINAFVAAHEVLIPIQCEYYALEGLSQLLQSIEMVRSSLNPVLRVSTILLTMYDGRTNLAGQVADEVRAHFPDETLAVAIPRSVRVSEAPSFGQSVIEYDPRSSAALSYCEAALEFAKRGN